MGLLILYRPPVYLAGYHFSIEELWNVMPTLLQAKAEQDLEGAALVALRRYLQRTIVEIELDEVHTYCLIVVHSTHQRQHFEERSVAKVVRDTALKAGLNLRGRWVNLENPPIA